MIESFAQKEFMAQMIADSDSTEGLPCLRPPAPEQNLQDSSNDSLKYFHIIDDADYFGDHYVNLSMGFGALEDIAHFEVEATTLSGYEYRVTDSDGTRYVDKEYRPFEDANTSVYLGWFLEEHYEADPQADKSLNDHMKSSKYHDRCLNESFEAGVLLSDDQLYGSRDWSELWRFQ